MANHPLAWPLLEISEFLAASLVAFSGTRPAGTLRPQGIFFEDEFDMIHAGFEPTCGLTAIAGLTQPGEPSVPDIAKEELFDSAFRDASSFLCFYAHYKQRTVLSPAEADRFDRSLHSSVARLCAGQFGFNSDPRRVFADIQELIQLFPSESWADANNFGKADCLGKILTHLSTSSNSRLHYGFVVGSEKQPIGCGMLFLRALKRTNDLLAA